MKFSSALTLGLAPLSMARKVRNSAQPARRDVELNVRDGHLAGGKEEHVSKGQEDPWAGGQDLWVDAMKGHGFTANAKTEVIIIWANAGGQHEKVNYNEKVTVTETVTAPGGEATPHPVAAATHTVTVGGPDGLIYQPEELHEVPIGDMIIFEFLAENHTVTQSGFDLPCDPLEGGMDTGHQPNPENTVIPAPQVAMQVTSEDPLWFYCKTGNHCGSGMVFSINAKPEKSHAQFKEKAIAQKGEGEATPITGGDPPADAPEGEAPAAPPAEAPKEEAPKEEAPKEEAPKETPAAPPPVEETPAAGGDFWPGKGVVGEDGSCHCMVSCASGGFPSEAQGVGATGGHGGSMPWKMAALR